LLTAPKAAVNADKSILLYIAKYTELRGTGILLPVKIASCKHHKQSASCNNDGGKFITASNATEMAPTAKKVVVKRNETCIMQISFIIYKKIFILFF
jgi:hypothetical protein